ncbi:hypothetical protein [Methyloversatilis sp.]|uniref:hypothetical protein n=1 Tax=Methyloversatilis sp. TaxID=2569862 RepID=UPI0035AE97C1
MHTREETLNRLAEIVKFVKKIKAKELNFDAWGRYNPKCGTICCVMGWLTESNMYSLKWATHRYSYPTLEGENCFRFSGFDAARNILFGDIGAWTEAAGADQIDGRQLLYGWARGIATNLFGVTGDSSYDEEIAMDHDINKLSHKKLFLLRVGHATADINNLYDEIEAENARVK